ncbi:MAG: glycosyltransferase [Candidatus Paceibacterota bacterium]
MKISLIIPCYNEELNIQKGVLDKIDNYTKDRSDFIEILIVDDGSTDSSVKIITEKYLKKFPKFRLIQNPHQGKAYAIMTGIRQARGDYVFFSDFDLATPIEEAEKLIRQVKNKESIIIGSRKTKRQGAPLIRKVQSIGFIIIRDLLVGLQGVRDTQCGFKMFEKSAALRILDKLQVFKDRSSIKGSSVSAGFDLEFLFLASKIGYNIIEVPVTWHHVETKNVHFIRDTIETLKDLIRIRLNDLRGIYEK